MLKEPWTTPNKSMNERTLNLSPNLSTRLVHMKTKPILAVMALLLISCQSRVADRITVHIPTAKTEAEYIWSTIQDIQFFEEHNYQVSLPKGPLIEELKQKAKSQSLSDADYERLERFVRDSVYKEADYQKGYDKIKSEMALINKMVNQIDPSAFNWNFKEFETYTVNLTLYGPGGSFDPDEGSLLVFTTPQGGFKNYKRPCNTIVHEIVHIGIEASIIAQYNVPHALKERIVDTFVSLYFKQYLPEYSVQDMGDYRTDAYLKEVGDFQKLSEIVDRIVDTKE